MPHSFRRSKQSGAGRAIFLPGSAAVPAAVVGDTGGQAAGETPALPGRKSVVLRPLSGFTVLFTMSVFCGEAEY
jgi:hypothetical protein